VNTTFGAENNIISVVFIFDNDRAN